MTLRNRLLALSLLTLLLPWSGWKLLQELERFLREAQETSLLSNARTLADTLPFEQLSQLQFLPQEYALLRQLERTPDLDGYIDDWPQADQTLAIGSEDGSAELLFMAGLSGGALYLVFELQANQAMGRPGNLEAYALELLLRSPRGMQRFDIHPEAPGLFQLRGESGAGQVEGQAEGYWLETARGFRLELVLPGQARLSDLQFSLQYPSPSGSTGRVTSAQQGSKTGWLPLLRSWDEVSTILAATTPESTQAWLVDRRGWVLADSGSVAELSAVETTWLQRLPYRLVAGGRTVLLPLPEESPMRLRDEPVSRALSGSAATLWSQDPDSAVLSNTVAVPVWRPGAKAAGRPDDVLGAIVLQSSSDGLLLLTNRALGRLLLTTLVITFGLAIGLWYFATRLSRRVRRLGAAVSVAMDEGMANALPLTQDRDELGELARNNEKLLRAVAEYNQYLQTLAGKLSHELKTPLAITRSSLENLSSLPLDEDSRRFLQRAQEGVERQSAIVRAMSEASRLEASLRVAEWEPVDLVDWLQRCAEGYRSVHPGRKIELELPRSTLRMRCAPELLAQAMDKLVDNAITMSGPGDRVRLLLVSKDDQVIIAVQNTGSELPEEFQGRLFDSLVSFRKGQHNATSSSSQLSPAHSAPHLGLGLYIVRLVAQAHGGVALARNLPQDGPVGEGVEFSLVLPKQ